MMSSPSIATRDAESAAQPGGCKPLPAALRSTHAATGHTVDFGRNVCMILGLTFDVVDCAGAEARIRAAAATRSRLFVSTPNTNFVISCQNDTAFRESVLHSDLSLIDGMPIVWVARLMGVPVPERVSGADIFERLGRPGSSPLSTYFFGGPPGGAANACTRLNDAGGPLTCLGFDAAGFGDVDDMSDPSTLERINASGADFLVVALGATKGQAWIEHNLPQLEVPIVSHLGAVVNFTAGSLKRAPVWMRVAGLEWLWRIKEEPHLWRRYVIDGWAFGRLLVTRVLPYVIRRQLSRPGVELQHQLSESDSGIHLRLSGSLCDPQHAKLKALFASLASQARPLNLDLSELTELDSAGAALLVLLCAHRKRCGLELHLTDVSREASVCLRYFGAETVVTPAPKPSESVVAA